MAAGIMPAASPKKDYYIYTKATRVILQAACSLPKHHVFSASISSFLLHNKNKKQKRCYLAVLAGQWARQTGWPALYNWRPYIYTPQHPPQSHWTEPALLHWNYLSPSARTDIGEQYNGQPGRTQCLWSHHQHTTRKQPPLWLKSCELRKNKVGGEQWKWPVEKGGRVWQTAGGMGQQLPRLVIFPQVSRSWVLLAGENTSLIESS